MTKVRYERPIIQKMNTGLMNKFGTRTEYEPVTNIESISVKSLINDMVHLFLFFPKNKFVVIIRMQIGYLKLGIRRFSLHGRTKQII